MELETHVISACRLRYLKEDKLESLQREVETLGKKINNLIQSLLRK